MTTHDDILARIAQKWIDMAPSRRTMPKKALPSHANEPSPHVLTVALPVDKSSLDVCGQFRLRHWKPGFNPAHVPTDYAWQIITPAGERLMLFTWGNWLRNSRKLFEEFCRETGRRIGTLSQEGVITLGEKQVCFRECRIVHEDELRAAPLVAVKGKSAKTIQATAERLLMGRKSQFEEIDQRAFHNDAEAHDASVQQRVEKSFRQNLTRYEKALVAKFGPPARVGSSEHRDIPHNGVLRHAIWTVNKKQLYLVLAHEDVELPWVIVLGVTV